MKTISITTRLLSNYSQYLWHRFTRRPVPLQALSIEITQKCVAKCVMCNIWKTQDDNPTLTVDDWGNILSSELCLDIRELDITGGEPFLVDDLIDLLNKISELKRTRLKKLKSIAITTNGLLTNKVIDQTTRALKTSRDAGLDLIIVCAMDAVGETHDRIRNFPDAWNKVNQTIDRLISLRESHANLIIGLKTTILPVNAGMLSDIADYAARKGLFTIISPIICTAGRYLNDDMLTRFEFTKQEKNQMIRFFEKEASKWSYHDQTLARYIKTGEMKKPCSCGYNYAFIRATGEFFLCPLVDRSVGNVLNETAADLFKSHKANQIRGKIGKMDECARCTEPGLERYSLVFQGMELLKLLAKNGSARFRASFAHMGLDKYWD